MRERPVGGGLLAGATRIVLLSGLGLLGLAGSLRADPLAALEQRALERYLQHLEAGQPGDAQRLDLLADAAFPGLRKAIESYMGLEPPIERHTHRAYLDLLDRIGRHADAPWPMLRLYAPQFAAFMVRPTDEHPTGQRLFRRLMRSGHPHAGSRLAVALTPEASLAHLADPRAVHRAVLFEAWTSRLAEATETRPIPGLGQRLEAVAATIALEGDPEPATLRAGLRFLGSWPKLKGIYERRLGEALAHRDRRIVQAGLRAQQRQPARLSDNATVVERFPDDAELLELAVGNFGFARASDAGHAATLRRLWGQLGADQTQTRFACLVSMAVHPQGNAALAARAARAQPWLYLDAASPILEHAKVELVRPVVEAALKPGQRGQEGALRLAHTRDLRGFEPQAIAIALDEKRPQILRQAALAYLGEAAGEHRAAILPLLGHENRDLRLAAILAFRSPRRLSDADMQRFGPLLVRIAMNDEQMGHRQEAIHALGHWERPEAASFFRQVLEENPPVILQTGPFGNDRHYWRYRLRVVALLALARLGDQPAYEELLSLHHRGSPAERTDVLLALHELGRVPELVFENLESPEPRLVATAVDLIRAHGSHAQRHRVVDFFANRPLFQQFDAAGIDDHQIGRLLQEIRASLAHDHGHHGHAHQHNSEPRDPGHRHTHHHRQPGHDHPHEHPHDHHHHLHDEHEHSHQQPK